MSSSPTQAPCVLPSPMCPMPAPSPVLAPLPSPHPILTSPAREPQHLTCPMPPLTPPAPHVTLSPAGLGPPGRRRRAKHDFTPANPGVQPPRLCPTPPGPRDPDIQPPPTPLCPTTPALGDAGMQRTLPCTSHPTVPQGPRRLGVSNPHTVDPSRAYSPCPVSRSNNNNSSVGGGTWRGGSPGPS